MSTRKALSPVIATLILSACVLMIGGGIWSYSLGAASSVATDYTDTTTDMVHTIIERFTIENVYYDSTTQDITVWVYNYGTIKITADVIVTVDDVDYYSYSNDIGSKTLGEVEINLGVSLAQNEEVTIEVWTEKENIEYEVYYAP